MRLDLGAREVPLRLRRNAKARRVILRLDPTGEGVVVTLPPGASEDAAVDLARREADWILTRLERRAPRVEFAPGARIPFAGRDHLVTWTGLMRGGVRRDDGFLAVSGPREHLARRLGDWLRAEARRHILPLVADKAAVLGRRPGRVTIRDTRSRWGSCAAGGDLSFCWRLVLAPPHVLDYVVAHEVAHLAHHDHSPRFWRAVDRLTPHAQGAKAWLHAHGADLHRYG
ncbi:MAG: M48 family metallopeptidase [Hyphomicrobiales bacterium]|nr:M48 family metallopeptidase [Hyphomicrobiales bacterium]MCP5370212.1 M48 family metallopeptidase [Hyphomicrobiales bacterium]